MDLCTVTNKKFIKSAINLVNSYRLNSYNKKVFIYCFDMSLEEVSNLQNSYQGISFEHVPKVVEYAYDPSVFFYKVYAIKDALNRAEYGIIYSDATNVFNKPVDLSKYLIDDSLFLPYISDKLTNQYWTTNKCIEKMQCQTARIMPQYWAGFQVYLKNEENLSFVSDYYNFMQDAEVALPKPSVKKPDGINSICIEHRQDQSVFSLLIHKLFRHQMYNFERQQLFGDWQTFKVFDNNYTHDLNNCHLSSRESKFGNYRFL